MYVLTYILYQFKTAVSKLELYYWICIFEFNFYDEKYKIQKKLPVPTYCFDKECRKLKQNNIVLYHC